MPLEDIGITILPAGPAGRANQMGGNFNIIIKGTQPENTQMAFEYLTSFTFDLEVLEARCKLRKEQKRVVGVPSLPVFKPEVQKKINSVINKYRTFPDYSDLMNEAAKHVRAEPPHFAQALYSEFLSPSVQKVLVSKDADCAAIMKKASDDFQKQYLDGLNKEILAEKK
jgi:hypothetical protein